MRAGDMLVLTDGEYAVGWDTPKEANIQHTEISSLRVESGELLLALEEPNSLRRVRILTGDGRVFWVHTEWMRIVS